LIAEEIIISLRISKTSITVSPKPKRLRASVLIYKQKTVFVRIQVLSLTRFKSSKSVRFPEFMEILVCAFCGQKTIPKVIHEGNITRYRCEHCDSLIAAYTDGFEKDLKFGSLFNKYVVDKYDPKLPSYVKKVARSDA
jgi:hypothetical protein